MQRYYIKGPDLQNTENKPGASRVNDTNLFLNRTKMCFVRINLIDWIL